MTELDILTTDELVEELKRRHPDGCVIALEFPEHERQESGFDYLTDYSGSVDVTLRLTNMLLWEQQEEIMGGSEE